VNKLLLAEDIRYRHITSYTRSIPRERFGFAPKAKATQWEASVVLGPFRAVHGTGGPEPGGRQVKLL